MGRPRARRPSVRRRGRRPASSSPAIRALEFAGLRDVHALARRMGLSTLGDPSQYGPSLALGGADVSLLDLTYAYSVLANGGVQGGMSPVSGALRGRRPFDPIPVLEVQDLRGKTLWRVEPRSERIVPAAQVFQVTSVLSDNEARAQMFGRSSPLDLGSRPAAVKTGLADEARHAWTFGYTSQLAVGVWVGNTDNRPMPGALSSQTAAPIWHDFMLAALAPLPVVPFSPPPDVALVQICLDTGLPPTRGCRRVVTEVFVEGAVPPPAPQPQTPERTVSPPPPGRVLQVQPPPQPAPEVRRDDRRGGRRGRR